MAKINYYDGEKYLEVEVSEEVAQAYSEISQEEKREHWRQGKRPVESSIEEMIEFCEEPISHSDVLEQYIEIEGVSELREAVKKLLPSQQELLRQIFFEYRTQAVLAKEKGIGKTAINNQLKRILEKLKKVLK